MRHPLLRHPSPCSAFFCLPACLPAYMPPSLSPCLPASLPVSLPACLLPACLPACSTFSCPPLLQPYQVSPRTSLRPQTLNSKPPLCPALPCPLPPQPSCSSNSCPHPASSLPPQETRPGSATSGAVADPLLQLQARTGGLHHPDSGLGGPAGAPASPASPPLPLAPPVGAGPAPVPAVPVPPELLLVDGLPVGNRRAARMMMRAGSSGTGSGAASGTGRAGAGGGSGPGQSQIPGQQGPEWGVRAPRVPPPDAFFTIFR